MKKSHCGIGIIVLFLFLGAVGFYYLFTTASRLEFDDEQIQAINYFGQEIRRVWTGGPRDREITRDELGKSYLEDNPFLADYLAEPGPVRVNEFHKVEDVTPDTRHIVVSEHHEYSRKDKDELLHLRTVYYNRNLEEQWRSKYIGSSSRRGRTMISEDGSRVLIVKFEIFPGSRDLKSYEPGRYLVVLDRSGDTVFEQTFQELEGGAISPDGRYLVWRETQDPSDPIRVVDLETNQRDQIDPRQGEVKEYIEDFEYPCFVYGHGISVHNDRTIEYDGRCHLPQKEGGGFFPWTQEARWSP